MTQVNTHFDLNFSPETESKFRSFYSIDDSMEFYDAVKSVIETATYKTKIVSDNTTDTVSIGNTVCIDYIPYSQKYIDYYNEQSMTGTVIFIDTQADNMFLFYDSIDTDGNKHRHIKSLEREGCHYFGMTRGYDYFIEKINNKN